MANNIYTSITRSPSTINRWNRPAFMPKGNLFAIGGVQTTGLGGAGGYNFSGYKNSFNVGNGLNFDAGKAVGAARGTSESGSGGFGGGKAAALQTAAGVGLSMMDSIPTGDKRGMWDTLDPVYHLAGGRESGAGNAMSDAGVALTKSGLQSGQPYMALAGAALKVIGGLTNAAFGIKENKEMKKAADASINTNRSFVSNAVSFDDIKGPAAKVGTNIYEGGWFSGGKARDKNEQYARDMANAFNWADASVTNNAYNIFSDKIGEALRNYSAFGGPLEMINNNNMGAIEYDFMSNYLANKKKQTEQKNSIGNMFAGTPDIFGFGGGIYTKGANFDTGVSFINKGGTHEQNPNDGVPMGVDSQGVPNLVEEGEVRWGDYMFSDRLIVPRGKRGNYGKRVRKYAEGGKLVKGKGIDTPYESKVLRPYEGLTFADAAKKIIKRNGADERDDAITMRGVDAQLSVLAGIQEKERQKEELREMQEAIDNMSPEEFAMLQQYTEQQQAQPQQQMANPMFIQQEGQMIPVVQGQAASYGGELFEYGGKLHGKVNIDGINWNDKAAARKALREAGYLKHYDSKKYKSFKEFAEDINSTIDKNSTKDYLKSLSPATRKYLADQNGISLENTDDENTDAVIDKLASKLKTPEAVQKSYNKGYNLPILDRAKDNVVIPEYAKVRETKTGSVLDISSLPDYKNDIIGKSQGKDKYRLAEGNDYFGKWGNDAKAVEDAEGYNDFTNYVEGLPEDSEQLKNLLEWYDSKRPTDYVNTFYQTDENGNKSLRKDWKTLWRAGREDKTLGALHVTPAMKEAAERSRVRYMLGDQEINAENYLDESGNWKENPFFTIDAGIQTTEDDGTKLTTYNLARNPSMQAIPAYQTSAIVTGEDGDTDLFPKPSNWPFALAAGLQLGSLGYNILKPTDYSNVDALLNASRDAGVYKPVEFRPIGNFLTYRPDDPWFYTSPIMAQSNATQRYIANKVSPSKGAETLANSYNTMLALGQAQRQQLDNNFNKYVKVGEYNKDTNKFNSEGFLKADMANQDAATRAAGYSLEGQRAAYAMRQAIDNAKANAISAGLSGLGNLAMAYGQNKWNNELFGWKLKHNQYPISQLEGYKYAPYTEKPVTASKGGKLRTRRKRSLSF